MFSMAPSAWGNKYVTNIQQGSITIGASSTSATATITSVDTTKSWIIYLGHICSLNADQNDRASVKLTFTNSTTITANRNTNDGATVNVVRFVVITAETHLVQSVQTGSIAVTASTAGTATISSVDLTRSAVFYLGETGVDSGAIIARRHGLTLTNATTVTATANSSTTASVGYVVVQFRATAINSIQQFNNAYTTANTTDNQTITAVVMANSMIAYGGVISGGTGTYSHQLTTTTNVQHNRAAISTTTRTPRYAVIEFKPGVIRSIQRNTQPMANISGLFGFLNDCSNTKSFINHTGTGMFSADPARARYISMNKSNSAPDQGEGPFLPGYSLNIDTSSVNTKFVAWEVIEFM